MNETSEMKYSEINIVDNLSKREKQALPRTDLDNHTYSENLIETKESLANPLIPCEQENSSDQDMSVINDSTKINSCTNKRNNTDKDEENTNLLKKLALQILDGEEETLSEKEQCNSFDGPEAENLDKSGHKKQLAIQNENTNYDENILVDTEENVNSTKNALKTPSIGDWTQDQQEEGWNTNHSMNEALALNYS